MGVEETGAKGFQLSATLVPVFSQDEHLMSMLTITFASEDGLGEMYLHMRRIPVISVGPAQEEQIRISRSAIVHARWSTKGSVVRGWPGRSMKSMRISRTGIRTCR